MASTINNGVAGKPAWTETKRTRAGAKFTAVTQYPHLVVRRAFRPRRGTVTNSPVTGANDILERLAELPLSFWTYGWDHGSVRHLGPMSQDFATAFGLGDSDRRIDMVDANGVVMAACQALLRRVQALESEVEALRASTATNDVEPSCIEAPTQ